ncbi:MAG: PACE efflux transporter [Gammaproteobacteria bacterium]|nr:PACE efflux transporter [Gammaproteobacteria bacterium]
MATSIVIRSGADRIRYALMFEAIIVVLFGVFAALFTRHDIVTTGSLALVLSLIALLINFAFNSIYDRIDVRYGRIPTERSSFQRLIHAILFEFVLVLFMLPVIMWWLQMRWWEALLLDLIAMAAIVVYTYFFTLAYDRVFPVKQIR